MMKIEQTGIDSFKVTLETPLEKGTIGKASKLKVAIECLNEIGFRSIASSDRVELERDGEAG